MVEFFLGLKYEKIGGKIKKKIIIIIVFFEGFEVWNLFVLVRGGIVWIAPQERLPKGLTFLSPWLKH